MKFADLVGIVIGADPELATDKDLREFLTRLKRDIKKDGGATRGADALRLMQSVMYCEAGPC